MLFVGVSDVKHDLNFVWLDNRHSYERLICQRMRYRLISILRFCTGVFGRNIEPESINKNQTIVVFLFLKG